MRIMITSVQMKTTRYGLSQAAGGWDGIGDSGTDSWLGNHGNALNTASCALTVSAEAAIAETLSLADYRRLLDGNGQVIPGRLKAGTILKIVWPGTHLVAFKTFDDRAPENDERLDIFLPWKDDSSIPDRGQVSVI